MVMARTRSAPDAGEQLERGETSLDAAMRAPSTTVPDVVVLDFIEDEVKVKDVSDPKKDLWLSTVDGRYSSPIIPVRVGPHAETFPVHRDILTKSEYFRRALDGDFKEAEEQAIDLPEEDPDIFSFVVAYLYEEKFVPIKAMANALVADPDKGKGKEDDDELMSGSEESAADSAGSASDESGRIRRRRENRRRRRAWEERQRKAPGRHRPDCSCQTCTTEVLGPPCWQCGAGRRAPPPRPRYHGGPPPGPVIIHRNGYPHPHPGPPPRRDRDRRRGSRNARDPITVVEEPALDERMSEEDLRTWSLAYELSVEVYVCADRYLMGDFKECVAAYVVNSFEIAGIQAALPSVLNSCLTLHQGVSSKDPLLKKVFARVGFLQARLGKDFPTETAEFFQENPDLALLIMREMVERTEEERLGLGMGLGGGGGLLPMERVMPTVFDDGNGRRPPPRDPYW